MKFKLYSVTVLTGLAALALSGCAHQPGDSNAPSGNPRRTSSVQAPEGISPDDLSQGGSTSSDFQFRPASRIEVATTPPGADYYWVSGYWDWTGDDWKWVPGVWDKPTKPGAKWSQAHWVKKDGAIVWVHGEWR
jgi:hypothetical protein